MKFTSKEVVRYDISLRSIANTFKKGHRIRVAWAMETTHRDPEVGALSRPASAGAHAPARADARAYGSLLLAVSARRGRQMRFAVALAEHRSGEFMLRQWIAGLIALGTLTHAIRAQAPDSSRLRTLQYRWVIGENVTSSGYVDPTTGMRYLLEDKVVLDVDGIERAEVHPLRKSGDSGWDVIVRLTPRAASEFAETTATHVGRTLAVLMDGHIVSTAVLDTPLRRVAGVVTNVPKSVADSIALRINAVKAPPPR